MALYELATNAAKHEILSTDTGRVEIGWGIQTERTMSPEFVMA